jgi:hypothetical protein
MILLMIFSFLCSQIAVSGFISTSTRPIASKFSILVINCERISQYEFNNAIDFFDISMNVCPWGFRGNAAQFLKTNRHQFLRL